jgi:lipopolysaccharide heptosyltransferase II
MRAHAPGKVLILKPSSLGDVVQALAVLRLLKRQYPAAQCSWWLAANLVPLLEHDPDLASIIPFDRQQGFSPRGCRQYIQNLVRMRRQRFDWVIDLHGLLRSGVLAWLANARFTVGVDDPREGAACFYDLVVPRPSPQTHAVDWYLQVLVRLGVPVAQDFDWLPACPDAQARFRAQWNPQDSPWIALNPGARWPNKRWPAAHFAALVRNLADQLPTVRFAILGGPSDQELGRVIAAADPPRCLDLTGRTSLVDMVEWIRFSQLLVTNDTGPMHVAAALKRPVVAPFGPTDPRRTGPYGQIHQVLQSRLPCVPCMKSTCHYERKMECMQAIDPARMAKAVRDQLASCPLC